MRVDNQNRVDRYLEKIIKEFSADLKESERMYECRKTFVYRMKNKFKRNRATIFRWIKKLSATK